MVEENLNKNGNKSRAQLFKKCNVHQKDPDLEIPFIQDQLIHFTCQVFKATFLFYHPDPDTNFLRLSNLYNQCSKWNSI